VTDGKKKRLGRKRLLYHAHRSSIQYFVLIYGLTYFFIAFRNVLLWILWFEGFWYYYYISKICIIWWCCCRYL